MRVLSPLFIPVVAVVVALPAGVLVFSRWRGANPWRTPLLLVTTVVAVIAAVVPNSGQGMYELGMSFRLIDLLEGGSYFLFVFALTGAWVLMPHQWSRWLLLALVPIALFEPLKWTWAFFLWSVWGFAP
jgi:hypothetical protein